MLDFMAPPLNRCAEFGASRRPTIFDWANKVLAEESADCATFRPDSLAPRREREWSKDYLSVGTIGTVENRRFSEGSLLTD